MRFSFALFAAGSLAFQLGTPVVKHVHAKRDGTMIANAIAAVTTAVSSLYQEITIFTGTGEQVNTLTYRTGDVFDAIEAGTKAANDSPMLTPNDTLPLVSATQNLSALSYGSIATLIQKKDVFVGAGIGPVILQTMKQQLKQSVTFNDAVLAKIPEALQAISKNLSAPITSSLEIGIQAYSDQATLRSASSRATAAPITGLVAMTVAVIVGAMAF